MAEDPEDHKLSDELKSALKSLVDHYEQEDKSVRQRQLIQWRRLKLYWNSFSNIYFNSVAHDWRVFDYQTDMADSQAGYYDKNVNVFKAYLESIIAAMSVSIPGVECYPEDAENPSDLLTAKAGNKAREIIFKHNNASLLWLHALYIWATEGCIFAYHYTHTDEEYGSYKEGKFNNETIYENVVNCPSCGSEIDEELAGIPEEVIPCPSCGQLVQPQFNQQERIETKLTESIDHPKSRICVEVYGGLNVKIPNYCRDQKDVPSIELDYECETSIAHSEYGDEVQITPGTYEDYEAWARLSPQYRGQFPQNVVTVRKRWLRPCAYYHLHSEALEKQLHEEYPDGVLVHLVNNQIARCEPRKLDDNWTISYDPLADFLHKDPSGQVLVNTQDMTNDMFSLMLQTVEHGVGQTFADPDVVNFDEYRQTEVMPGSMIPAKARSGKALGDGFFEISTAQFGSELLPFFQTIQEMAQLTSGATPSLYGGAQPNSSKTAAQYTMSNSNARQRLNTPWKMLSIWWKEMFSKLIPAYIEIVKEQGDENFVKKDDNGSFINVFVRKNELDGKIGDIELESSEELPTTWAQKKEAVTNLMSFNNPVIMQALMAPENLPMLTEAMGLTDFILPGENDRQATLEDIVTLLETEPIVIPPEIDEMTGMPAIDPATMMPAQEQEIATVEADPVFANPQVRFEVVKNWITSEAGRLAKTSNPKGYKNVLLYGMEYYQLIQQQMMQQAMAGQAGDQTEQDSTKPAKVGE